MKIPGLKSVFVNVVAIVFQNVKHKVGVCIASTINRIILY